MMPGPLQGLNRPCRRENQARVISCSTSRGVNDADNWPQRSRGISGWLRCVRVAAWVLWVSVHFVALIGLRNRLLVLISWAWDYLFYEAAVRSMLLKAVWV